ncbi:MAG: ATP-grasp domain-containing protein, partial [Marmoricola sp.]|nr:ATP-grasp domain-containing protein [Marmoricola sp.]
VMDLMGRKDAAREVAVKAGVPVVPAYDLEDDPAGFDYPVLVKAAAGGGGKGMRVVRDAAGYAEALEAARREARSAFGDDAMLIEKYVESGRHVEVQVIADSHGHVLHLFERDCSSQRRHQKVLEEAPAPTITDEQRTRVTSSAVTLAAEVGYVNAGTVEFLLDNASGEVYFLEMNTRLQVEHPVTEGVVTVAGAGLDLVELQLRVAAGEELGFTQDDVALGGHAIEARIYAEDSFGGFLPQAGTATLVRWPATADGTVRVDEALESGQTVSTSYDPMLGKVIAHGRDRESARRALVAALDETAILGLTTNTGFVRTIAAGEEFRDATIDTAWLDRHEVPPPDRDAARRLAAWELFLAQREADGPFRSDGFRLGGPPAPVTIQLDEVVALTGPPPPTRAVCEVGRHQVELSWHGQRFVFERPDVMADHGSAVGEGSLTAPMPGTVLAVDVAEGETVEAGQRLGVLEAMKMELALRAPFDGTVATVGAAAGDQVKLGAALFEVEASDGD